MRQFITHPTGYRTAGLKKRRSHGPSKTSGHYQTHVTDHALPPAYRHLYSVILAAAGTFLRFVLLPVFLFSYPTQSSAQNLSSCPNADFEQNSFINWVGTTGACCPINSPNNGIVTGRHTIMSGPGFDPSTPAGQIPVVAPGGQYSARLGNSYVGYQAEQLRYTFTVSPQTELFIYRYAVVLQDPNHTAAAQPRFEIRVFDSSGQIVPCGSYNVVASANIPGFQSYGSIRYKTWTTVGIELSAYMNQAITIEFSTGDCGYGGHFGYAYVDCYCSPLIITSDVCPGTPYVTLDAPVGFSSYLWTTGQTTSSIIISNPVMGSQYTVTMTSVTGCTVSLSTVITATQLVAAFNVISNCAKWATFQDSSYVIGGTNATNWLWSFGDGDTSILQNPVHHYQLPGQYLVTLIAGNAGGCFDTLTTPVTIIGSPDAAFSVGGTSCSQTDVTFTDLSVFAYGTITGWHWDFGDGATSSLQHNQHTYALPGSYVVTLAIQGSNGCTDTLRLTVNTLVTIQANFQHSVPCENMPVTFTDTSAINGGFIASWQWDFGDGSQSLLTSPAHMYLSTGSYTVTLIVTAGNGCTDTLQRIVTILPSPKAGFSSSITCFGDPVLLTGISLPGGSYISSWNWNFGDSTTSTQQSPIHTYQAAGSYSITLYVQDSIGCTDTITGTAKVKEKPIAGFQFSLTCSNLPVVFTDSSHITGDTLVSWFWDFGDGDTSWQQHPAHLFPVAGIYQVLLIVSGSNGCMDTMTQSVSIMNTPMPSFTVPVICQGSPVTFTDQTSFTGTVASYNWTFGGNVFSNMQNPVYTFPLAGSFSVSQLVIGTNGCRDSVSQMVFVNPKPDAGFIHVPACVESPMQFTDTSGLLFGNILQWTWDFGDSSTVSNDTDPVHAYAYYAGFAVTLMVESENGCRDTVTQLIFSDPLPDAGFVSDTACHHAATSFHDQTSLSSGAVINWLWNFGDHLMETEQHPIHYYSQTGNYLVSLVVASDRGCRDTVFGPVTVYPLPQPDFYAASVCYGDTTSLLDMSLIVNGSVEDWYWNFGDGTTLSHQSNPSHWYSFAGIFDVGLTAVSAVGCRDSMVRQIQVYHLPDPEFSADPLAGCIPLDVSFTDLSTSRDGTISQWFWIHGSSFISTEQHPAHTYKHPGRYSVSLGVQSSFGCKNCLEKPEYIDAYPLPEAGFSFSPSNPVMLPEPVQFLDESGGAVQWYYQFGDGNESWENNPVHQYFQPGFVSVTQIVTSIHMCMDTLTKIIELHTDKAFFVPNAFSPNQDGKNETFTGSGFNVAEYHMELYDRFGQMVYATSSINLPWDGTMHGTPAPEGVYIYRIVYTDVFGLRNEAAGRVTLIR